MSNLPPLVVITGASSGIGQALAEHYARAGWRLALIVRKEAETKTWLSASGASANSYQIHLADVADIEGMLAVGKAILAAQGVVFAKVRGAFVKLPARPGWPLCSSL